MTNLNIHEAKTHLSKYLAKVQEGETIVLCKDNKPIALITPLPKGYGSKKNLFGLAKGFGEVTPEFFEDLNEKDFPGIGL